MYIERLLQISIALLCSLGALLLGMAQRSVAMPLWVLIAGVASIALCDVTGWVRLNRTVTNVAAVLALALSSWQLAREPFGGVDRIYGIANLLVYLQVILLFQEKSFGTYSHLAVLSLMQVLVAAKDSQGTSFGLMLTVYLAAALGALALLFLHRERTTYQRSQRLPPPPDAVGRWPLSGQTAVFSGAVTGSASRAGIGRELWSRLATMVVGTLILALLVFFTMPRFGRGHWRGGGRMRTVGYSKSIQLGSLGRMLENPREVMRIQFLDAQARQPYDVVREIYLRGALLTDYRRGRWLPWQRRDPERSFREVRSRPLVPGETLVLQEITLQPLDQPEVFCIWPFLATQNDRRRILYDVEHDRLLRAEPLVREVTTFELGTTGLAAGQQLAITPCEADQVMDTDLLLQMPADWQTSLRGLTALAARWVRESPLPADDRYGRAVLLERKLRDSGEFQYSMEGQKRDSSLDPVEDFVTKHPRGHCEYFATALALMLRSQGYPARVVIGFKSDEWNRLGHFCTVRQLHAHTWVEVYLEPNSLPAGTRISQRDSRWTNGGWLRLDATPASEESQAGLSLLKRADGWLTWLDYVWDSYVMQMDSPKQREAVYDPLGRWLTATARRLVDPGWWRRVCQGAWQSVASRWQSLRDQGWLGWRGIGLAGGALLMLGLGVAALAYLWRRRAGRRPVPHQAATASLARVRFYRRLETILARHGLSRPEGQTQREFARHAGQQLADATGQGQLAELPLQVAEAFYQVRFGGLALDKPQSEAVEQALSGLEHAGSSRVGHAAP